ncbi:uncharacterized protein DS421_14g476430 [Arachis hypogaea]|nr:uncharacterized protein DS421_14g476430 [Arachis hypogaea]
MPVSESGRRASRSARKDICRVSVLWTSSLAHMLLAAASRSHHHCFLLLVLLRILTLLLIY